MHPRHHNRNNKGFTLIELLVVIAIVGVLSAIVMASLSSSRQKADDSKRLQDMAQLKNAFEIYASKHNGAYPVIAVNRSAENNLAQNENGKVNEKKTPTFISGLLSFTAKPAEAAVTHSDNACAAFDILADALVADGDLNAVPRDPHDTSAGPTCYKAWTDGDTVAVWSYTWQKYENISSGSSEAANKHSGFLVSRQSELNREKIMAICEATNGVYGDADTYPVINPYSSSTLCGGAPTPDDGLIADAILGVSTGDETVITSELLIANGGSCSINADCTSANCVSGFCQSIADGTCSDSQYTDSASCTSNGSCSSGGATDQSSCESYGTCSNGYSDISQSDCLNVGGSCSAGGYGNQSECTAVGYCSNGSYVDEATCTSYNTGGYCSSGDYPDEPTCYNYGYCNNGSSNVTSSECYSYGSCYSNDQCSDGSTYNNNEPGCMSAGCSWSAGSYSWTSNTWYGGTSYSWSVNTWSPTYSWSSNGWTPNVWTPN